MEHGFSILFLCCHRVPYILITVVLVLLDVLCTLYGYLHMIPFTKEYHFLNVDQVGDIMIKIQVVGGISNAIVSVLWFHLNKSVIFNVGIEMSLLGVDFSDPSVRKCLKEVLTVFLVAITVTVINFSCTAASWDHLTQLIPFLINSFFLYGFIGLLSCSLLQLATLYNDFIKFNKYEDSVLRCQRISTIFEKICHLFKLPMFLIVGWSFLLSMCDLYVLFNSSHESYRSVLFLILFIPYFQYPIFTAIRSCNELNKKAKIFNQQLYWEMVEDRSFKLLKNEKLNFHFLVNEEMIFTACGFFTIDNSLIFSMISTATTYLVIVLQYGKNDKPMVLQPSTDPSLEFVLPTQH